MGASCYELVITVDPGGARRLDRFTYNRLEHIFCCLHQEFLPEERDESFYESTAYLAVVYGEDIDLSVIDRGKLLATIDLKPFISARIEGLATPVRGVAVPE